MKLKCFYIFWGVMDLLYIAQVCYFNLSQGRVPIYSDIRSFISLSQDHGFYSVVFFWLTLALAVSIVFSMVLFFREMRLAAWLAYAQAPFRVLFVVPSLPFLLGLVKASGVTSVFLLFGFLLLSELIKVLSIFFRERFL